MGQEEEPQTDPQNEDLQVAKAKFSDSDLRFYEKNMIKVDP